MYFLLLLRRVKKESTNQLKLKSTMKASYKKSDGYTLQVSLDEFRAFLSLDMAFQDQSAHQSLEAFVMNLLSK